MPVGGGTLLKYGKPSVGMRESLADGTYYMTFKVNVIKILKILQNMNNESNWKIAINDSIQKIKSIICILKCIYLKIYIKK